MDYDCTTIVNNVHAYQKKRGKILTTIKQDQCMICTGNKLSFIHKLRDEDKRNVYRCMTCEHIQVLPLPTAAEDEEYYQSDKMYKNIFLDNSAMQKEENLMIRFRAYVKDEVEKLKNYISKDDHILDIGTGYGWLVEFLRNDGYLADGVEISNEKRELCKLRCGIDIFGWNFMVDVPEVRDKYGYYDVICLQQTLEHISSPINFLQRAMKLLKPGGRIFVSVPNQNDNLKIIEPEYINYHYCRSHLSYFTPQTLTFALNLCGFKNIKIYGHQVYSIENHIYWVRNKRPYLNSHLIDLPNGIEWINRIYKKKLEDELSSNVIIGIGYKDNLFL